MKPKCVWKLKNNHKATGKFSQCRKVPLLTDNKLKREESGSVFYWQTRGEVKGDEIPYLHNMV